ncbi:MAG: Gfo/Idh/MocA family protein [Candidatus Dormibacteraceae bacterium]
MTQTAKVGVLGAGNVTPLYLPNLLQAPGLEVNAIADVDRGAARRRAEEYGVARVLEPDELISDLGIELVLNFTPIPLHVETTRRALAAGKHVYSEKPLATTTADALSLVQEATRRQLRLGCAPDTLLGSGLQAARSALEAGRIGRPLGAGAFMFRSLPGRSDYATGPFALFDMAPYYVTTLVTLLGPARRVVAMAQTLTGAEAEAQPEEALVSFTAAIEFDHRVMADLLLAWGTNHRHEIPSVHVFGTEGDLQVPNPNGFGEAASIRAYGEPASHLVEGSVQPDAWPRQQRGLGVAEMVEAIREGRPPRASGEMAAHVVDVIAGVVTSAESGQPVTLTTSCSLPSPLAAGARARLLGR